METIIGQPSRNFLKSYGLSLSVLILVVGLFWIGYDCRLDHLYAPSPYHRLQVKALLSGRLSLSSSIEEVDHGLTWHNGNVNQVWGLGIPLWMLPFESVYRFFGKQPCPDRIPLLAAVALIAWYVSRTAILMAKALRLRAAGVSFACLVLLFPPLWNLIFGPRAIFEQTVLYACLVSTALLVAVVRFLFCQRPGDFWVVCVLGGVSGLVRVTHGAYGMVAGLICGFVMLASAIPTRSLAKNHCDWRKIGELLLGWTVLLGGFFFLALSNSIRFGSVMECGHRLTHHSLDVIYLTRFGNPFEKTGLIDASKEFFSWVFLSPFHHYRGEASHLVPWQASAYRWREPTQLTFDPSFLLIIMFSCAAGAIFLNRRARRYGRRLWQVFDPCKPVQCVIAGMLVWFVASSLLLAGFYLHAPILVTRYILDFAPSFLAPFVITLLLLARRWPRLIPALLLVWLCCESTALCLSGGTPSVRAELSKEELFGLPAPNGRKLPSFNGRYAVENHPLEASIKYNGEGWDRDGTASPLVTLALDCPEFLEILVGPRQVEDGVPDNYKAKIGNTELPMESLIRTRQGSNLVAKVRFSIPEEIRRQNGNQLAFLCFTKDWEEKDRRSHRRLYEVRWKELPKL
jgi:hypothetical protein